MLEWYQAISDEPQITYMLPDATEAKARYVLPKPEDVMRIAGRQATPVTKKVRLSVATIGLKTKAVASENVLEKLALNFIEVSFDKLKEKKDAKNIIPEIIKKTSKLGASKKVEIAQLLQSWLNDGGMWGNEQYSNQDWYKQVEKLLTNDN